jgi:NADH dehydrogenase
VAAGLEPAAWFLKRGSAVSRKRIVIIGGGFGGVKCARVLSRALKDADISLFSRDNHMVFTPLLADVAGSSLSPGAVVAPLRQMLPKVHCRAETVTRIDPANKRLEFCNFGGETGSLNFDELVIAIGNRVDLGRVPGMVTYAMPLKTVGDAIAMRMHVMRRMEEADVTQDAERRRWLLSFVVIGGGFSGVEVAGELNDLTRHVLKYYRNINREEIRVTLIHSRDQILPEVKSRLRDFARTRMARAGIHFELEQRATVVTRKGVQVGDGRCVEGGTIVCTIGNSANPLIEGAGLATEKGRIRCQADLRVVDQECIWSVGDCALVPNAHDGDMAPPTAQFAEREGGQAASNIIRKLKGEPTRPFSFKPVGVAAGIGSRKGVAELFGVRVSGFFAFWLWRSAFLAKLPSFVQKIKVGLDWAWELVFPREISVLNMAQTQPVSRAFFAEGEVIFDSSARIGSVYAIDCGECEIVIPGNDGKRDRVLIVLGRGELVGQSTLQSYSNDRAVLRARVNTEMLVLAGDFLERVSGVLKPLSNLLRQALHTQDGYWKESPEALKALAEVESCAIMREPPAVEIAPDTRVLAAFRTLKDSDNGFALISGKSGLAGIVTRTDLIKGLEKGLQATVSQVMTSDPLSVRSHDTAAVAAGSMREHGLKWMPVIDEQRQVIGVLHADDLVTWVLDRVEL